MVNLIRLGELAQRYSENDRCTYPYRYGILRPNYATHWGAGQVTVHGHPWRVSIGQGGLVPRLGGSRNGP